MDFFTQRTAGEYLSHAYSRQNAALLPLPDEEYVTQWRRCSDLAASAGLLTALSDCFSLPVNRSDWEDKEKMALFLAVTPVGHIPVLEVAAKPDFIQLEQILSDRKAPLALPDSVNAFALSGKPPVIAGHRLLLLSGGGYCALPAGDAGFSETVWLEKSRIIRLMHECSHYCTLRIFGGMKNHLLDELIADCMGQLAAFGCFRADLQRKFFGLDAQGQYTGGRLAYYCRLPASEFAGVCRYAHKAIEELDCYLRQYPAMASRESQLQLLMLLAVQGILPIAKGDFAEKEFGKSILDFIHIEK